MKRTPYEMGVAGIPAPSNYRKNRSKSRAYQAGLMSRESYALSREEENELHIRSTEIRKDEGGPF